MRINGLLLAAQWLYGQQTAAQSVNKVLYFANTDSRQGMQQINNAIRATTSISADLDLTQRTLEVSGTAKEIELSEWVFNELDRPAISQASQSPNLQPILNSFPTGRPLPRLCAFSTSRTARVPRASRKR
jgi:hypothetical protein